MFQADIRFRDIDSPFETSGGGIFFGRSSIVPVRHRMLRTSVFGNANRLVVVSRERFADDCEEFEISSGLTDEALDQRLREIDDHPFEFAVLSLDRSHRSITYRASPLVTVPAYLIAEQDGVVLDWDYARLLRDREAAVDRGIALAQIAGLSTYGARTIVEGLYRTAAGASLVASDTGVEIMLPDPVVHDGPHRLAPDAGLEAKLFETIKASIDARPFRPSSTAIELSGGMDSALTALAAAALGGPGLLSVGAQFAGAMGDAQRARREILRDNAGFADISIPAERFLPFGAEGRRRVRHGVWPEDENYPELFEAIFAMLRSAGIDTLVSGLGGDELYPIYIGEEADTPDPDIGGCPFLTPEGCDAARAGAHDYPRGWLQETSWLSGAGRAQRLLRYGLWPINPYINEPLARFVSRLPYDYRADRRLLRDTLTRLLRRPVFAHGYVKETFDPVAVRGIIENRAYLLDLVERAPLMSDPAIDRSAVVMALESDISALDRGTYNALFRLLKILSFFQ